MRITKSQRREIKIINRNVQQFFYLMMMIVYFHLQYNTTRISDMKIIEEIIKLKLNRKRKTKEEKTHS